MAEKSIFIQETTHLGMVKCVLDMGGGMPVIRYFSTINELEKLVREEGFTLGVDSTSESATALIPLLEQVGLEFIQGSG